MWVILWHALLWVPKLLIYGAQRVAVWSGTMYLFRKGKYHKIFYVLSALLYIGSWVFIVLAFRETFTYKLSHLSSLLRVPRKVS